jgi:hypothetical protein
MEGREGRIARKIFHTAPGLNFIHVLLYGAPVDYQWCEAAAEVAFHRRRVLAVLVSHWFGDRVRLADATGFGLDRKGGRWYLDTEYVEGHPARLRTPFLPESTGEFQQLRSSIFPRLQNHLIEAGFVGTAWQAGKGQPCAIANFLVLDDGDRSDRQARWAWIDTESAVPAIASYDVRSLVGFYLPEAVRRGRILFDDLDEGRLRRYVSSESETLREDLGEEAYARLLQEVDVLVEANRRWANLNRLHRSLGFGLFSGDITPKERDYYEQRPLRWYSRLIGVFLVSGLPRALAWLGRRAGAFLRIVNPIRWGPALVRIVWDRNYRLEVGRAFVQRRIEEWGDRGRFTEEERERLERELVDDEQNQYLADFGVHLAIKPLGWLSRVAIVPGLWYAGIVSPAVGSILILFAGLILRVSYSLYRFVQEAVTARSFLFVAVGVSMIPSAGTVAFPCQMVYDARRGSLVPQFIVYSVSSTLAWRIPIWGGPESEWEYLANGLAHRIVRWGRRGSESP